MTGVIGVVEGDPSVDLATHPFGLPSAQRPPKPMSDVAANVVYLRGDATNPQASGQRIVAHVCNDLGGWGKGFVLAISKRWPEPERQYRQWHRSRIRFELGEVQLVRVTPFIQVANMIGQHDMKTGSAGPPIRYDALEKCLSQVAAVAAAQSASVHMPRIGCGLAGGKWSRVEPLIERTFLACGVDVYVYDFE